ncbi:MAG TPA: hypothetical protein VGJ16_04670, partial [Pirellulales bacterium]
PGDCLILTRLHGLEMVMTGKHVPAPSAYGFDDDVGINEDGRQMTHSQLERHREFVLAEQIGKTVDCEPQK